MYRDCLIHLLNHLEEIPSLVAQPRRRYVATWTPQNRSQGTHQRRPGIVKVALTPGRTQSTSGLFRVKLMAPDPLNFYLNAITRVRGERLKLYVYHVRQQLSERSNGPNNMRLWASVGGFIDVRTLMEIRQSIQADPYLNTYC